MKPAATQPGHLKHGDLILVQTEQGKKAMGRKTHWTLKRIEPVVLGWKAES